jgi:23S rRNA (adenine2503-C2)-methyltransferase
MNLSNILKNRDVPDPDLWSDLSKSLRSKIKNQASIYTACPDLILESITQTRKFRFLLNDGAAIESVLIPDGKRLTACISTQVGCKMGCTFCATGLMGFSRNLQPSEIIEQIMAMNRWLIDNPMKKVNQKGSFWKGPPENGLYTKISHIVVMGMGEPFDNVHNLAKSISILESDLGLQYAGRRITVSTCGHIKGMTLFKNYCENLNIKVLLALSIGSPFDEERSVSMPVNKKWPLEDLINAIKIFPHPSRERVTLEYTLIKDHNDSAKHAEALAKFAHKCKGKVNLIPLNEHIKSNLKTPSTKDIESFQKILLNKKILTTIRKSLGQDIEAACGMLGRSSNVI